MASFLWLSWKDIQNPQAGGAERVGHEIRTRLVFNKHEVIHYTGGFKEGKQIEDILGVKTIRVNAPRTLLSAITMSKVLPIINQFDYIIEEVNTSPYFSSLFIKDKSKHYLLFHQLTKDVWNHEFPFPLSTLGEHILEPTALKILSKMKPTVFAMSNSTKIDLVKSGFNKEKITMLPEATNFPPINDLIKSKKEKNFTVLYFGSLRAMKRPEDVIKAFAHTLKGTKAKLWISGSGGSKRKDMLKNQISKLGIQSQTTWYGRVDDDEKRKLMEKSHIISMTSVKEGWGIIITEAGVLGTPSVVYDVDGLRDSTINKETGIVVDNNDYKSLGLAFKGLMDNKTLYTRVREGGYNFHKKLTFDNTYEEFRKSINLV